MLRVFFFSGKPRLSASEDGSIFLQAPRQHWRFKENWQHFADPGGGPANPCSPGAYPFYKDGRLID